MKPRIVSALAVLFCFAIFAIVGEFGYNRYKAAQVKDAEFSEQLMTSGKDKAAALSTHMPPELSGRSGSAPAGDASASPRPQQP